MITTTFKTKQKQNECLILMNFGYFADDDDDNKKTFNLNLLI